MSEFEKNVFIDMDGTMVDFDNAALRDIPLEQRVQRNNFYVVEDYPFHMRLTIEAVYQEPDFFEKLELLPGVKENWQALLDNGYLPQVLSAPLSSNPWSIAGKKKSLELLMVPDFGKSVVEEAIFDKEKWNYSGLALVDDRPKVPKGPSGQDIASWEQVLFGWPHLSTVPLATTAFRLLDWQDPELLLDILARIKFQNK